MVVSQGPLNQSRSRRPQYRAANFPSQVGFDEPHADSAILMAAALALTIALIGCSPGHDAADLPSEPGATPPGAPASVAGQFTTPMSGSPSR
jgi:hypothetical protein